MHGKHLLERQLLNLKFLRGRTKPALAEPPNDDAVWELPRQSTDLLATPYRQQLLGAIRESTSLTRPVFDAYVKQAVHHYAELVQLLPASESHHHSYPGGMLDHGLEMCVYGLRLRRQHLLPPGAKPEEQSSSGELWSVAVIYASLMHDIAKVLVDVEVWLKSGIRWYLWEGRVPDEYRVRYVKGRDYFLHSAINPLLCQRVVGNSGLEWLISQPDLFAMVMYTISGHAERSGVIGEIVRQADKASVAKSLGGNIAKLTREPVDSLQNKIKLALRHVVKEKLRLNEKGGQGFVTDDALWLVTPLVPREIKSYLLSHGIEGVPSNESRLYDEMQAHGLIVENSEGKAVWKCQVEMGDWQASFSMLKVHTSIIWGEDENFERFSGQVCVSKIDALKVVEDEGKSGEVDPSSTDQVPSDNSDMEPSKEKSLGEEHGSLEDSLLDIALGGETEEQPINSREERVKDEYQGSVGKDFLAWLKASLQSHKLLMNDSKALVHTVEGMVFIVSPKIFKLYCQQEVGAEAEGSWKAVQEAFQKLKLHNKNTSGGSFYRVRVVGPNKKTSFLSGYLVKREVLLDGGRVVLDNPFLELVAGENVS